MGYNMQMEKTVFFSEPFPIEAVMQSKNAVRSIP